MRGAARTAAAPCGSRPARRHRSKWTIQESTPDHRTDHSLAADSYTGKEYGDVGCLYVRRHTDGTVRLSGMKRRSGGYDWLPDTPVPNSTTDGDLGFATWFTDTHLAYRGSGSDEQLYYRSGARQLDGTWTWAEPEKIPGAASATGASLAHARNHLYCVYRGTGSDETLYWTRKHTRGGDWDKPQRLGGQSKKTPALALIWHPDGYHLLCVHRGETKNQNLYWTQLSCDEAGQITSPWSNDKQLGAHMSAERPALVAQDYYKDGKDHTQVMCMHRGHGAD